MLRCVRSLVWAVCKKDEKSSYDHGDDEVTKSSSTLEGDTLAESPKDHSKCMPLYWERALAWLYPTQENSRKIESPHHLSSRLPPSRTWANRLHFDPHFLCFSCLSDGVGALFFALFYQHYEGFCYWVPHVHRCMNVLLEAFLLAPLPPEPYDRVLLDDEELGHLSPSRSRHLRCLYSIHETRSSKIQRPWIIP